MDYENLDKLQIGKYVKKTDFMTPQNLKIVSIADKPNSFNEKKTDIILGLRDKDKNDFLLQISKTNLKDLGKMFGGSFEQDIKGQLVTVSAISTGKREVEGVERDCYELNFAKA